MSTVLTLLRTVFRACVKRTLAFCRFCLSSLLMPACGRVWVVVDRDTPSTP